MPRDVAESWMWAEACEMLARAERLHRHFFEPRPTIGARFPVWEPPVDVLETKQEVLILVALPGVDPAQVEARIEDGLLHIAGQRVLPPELHGAVVHRLELPQGHFERRVRLPPGRYGAAVRHALVNGCLLVRLAKLA
jgi:HSP20 family molecular chaperone IbpA